MWEAVFIRAFYKSSEKMELLPESNSEKNLLKILKKKKVMIRFFY